MRAYLLRSLAKNALVLGAFGCLTSVAFAVYIDNWFTWWLVSVALIGFGAGLYLKWECE